MNKDYLDILQAFGRFEVEFLLVGAYALAQHGYVRYTGDLDLWVRTTPQNAAKVWRALQEFGAPLSRLTEAELAESDWVFQMGVAPQRIDILGGVDGLDFESALKNSIETPLWGTTVKTLSISDLIENKSRTGRAKDQVDVIELKRIRDHKMKSNE